MKRENITLIQDFYTIDKTENNQNHLTYLIHLNKNHDVFKGHFPKRPVLPGVCIIQIIKELAGIYLNTDLQLNLIKNVRFSTLINPEINQKLKINIEIIKKDKEVYIINSKGFIDIDSDHYNKEAFRFLGYFKDFM